MSWAEIKHSVNSTLGVSTKTIDKITDYQNYINLYNNIKFTAHCLELQGNTQPYFKIYEDGTYSLSLDDFSGGSIVILPPTLTMLNGRVSESSLSIKSIFLPPSLKIISSGAFKYITISDNGLRIPNFVEQIEDGAFDGTHVKNIIIGSGIKQVGNYILQDSSIDDSTVENVFFEGTPINISENAFKYAPNLKNIYVPWSKDAVNGAPWGASGNVSIIYGCR